MPQEGRYMRGGKDKNDLYGLMKPKRSERRMMHERRVWKKFLEYRDKKESRMGVTRPPYKAKGYKGIV